MSYSVLYTKRSRRSTHSEDEGLQQTVWSGDVTGFFNSERRRGSWLEEGLDGNISIWGNEGSRNILAG